MDPDKSLRGISGLYVTMALVVTQSTQMNMVPVAICLFLLDTSMVPCDSPESRYLYSLQW